MVLAADGGALLDLVGGEVFGGDEAAAGFFEVGDLMGHRAFVEVVGVFSDAGESRGQLGLLEGVALFIEVAVALKDFCGCWEAGEVSALQATGFFGGEGVAVGGEFDGGGHVLREGEFAVVPLRVGEAGYRAGDSAGLVADERHAGDNVALGVEVHVAGGCGGSFFAVVEEVGFAVVIADEHEASAAEVACKRIDDGESEADGYGCVDGVAALLEDFDAGVGGVVLDGDDHGVFGARWFFGDGNCLWCRLGCESGRDEAE